METIHVGLIPSPDLPDQIVHDIIDDLKHDLKKSVDSHIDWQFEIKVDSFIGAAEYINESVDKAALMKEEQGWDYAICLTDLPSFSGNKVVIADVSSDRGAALISLPSFGTFTIKRKVRKALTYITDLLHEESERDQEEKIATRMSWRFLLSKIQRVTPEENANTDVRYVVQSRLFGWIRLLSGMVFANRPWLALSSLKKILTLAFATGTYISIFSTPWELSVAYSVPRFIVLMVLSIVGMVIWFIFAHNLWEKSTSKSQSQYRRLYNGTTIMTLVVITVINYIVLFTLFICSISLFVPAGLFESWTDVSPGTPVENYLRLAWLITSLGLLAGAVGATAEKEDKIRHMAYAYRQLNRYYEMEQENAHKMSEEEKQSYSGTTQSHREGDG